MEYKIKNNKFYILIISLLLLVHNLSAEIKKQTLQIGVLPYININGLIKAYEPLITYLEEKLEQPVIIVSARNYEQFLKHTSNKEYDLIITASHFARYAHLAKSYKPIFRPLTTYHELFIVNKNSDIYSMEDLKNKKVAIPNILAQTTILGRKHLKEHGINPDKDLTIIDAKNHKNALFALQQKSVDAAIVSTGGYRHSSDDVKNNTRILKHNDNHTKIEEAIPLIYMINNDLNPNKIEKIISLIDQFANQTEIGKDWIINKRKYKGLREPTQKEMELLDSHVEELKEVMRR